MQAITYLYVYLALLPLVWGLSGPLADPQTVHKAIIHQDASSLTDTVRSLATQTAGPDCVDKLVAGSPWKAAFVLRPKAAQGVFFAHGVGLSDFLCRWKAL